MHASTSDVSSSREARIELSGRSALALELSRLPPDLRELLVIDDGLIVFTDIMISVSRVLIDDSDSRSWRERLKDVDVALPEIDEERLQLFADGLSELAREGNPTLARIKDEGFQRFLRRLLGAARYDRLELALRSDAAVMVVAVRRILRNIMPIAVALDDCFAVVRPGQMAHLSSLSQLSQFSQFSQLSYSVLQAILQIDTLLDKAIDIGLPILSVPAREEEVRASKLDLDELADQLHILLESQSGALINSLSRKLARKVQGARQALEFSEDGISQAANSLVELVDRLLRESFDRDSVVEWVEREYPQSRHLLLFEKEGRLRPTKRAEALCFVYAGQPAKDNANGLHELVATALAEARSVLEKIKHADTGSPEELDSLKRQMAAVEGALVYALRVGWAIAGDEELKALQVRLGS